MSGEPYPKAAQLARGERRDRKRLRKMANALAWRKLRGQKYGPCRGCGAQWWLELHHVVKRSAGGDDVADNLVMLCRICHGLIHRHRDPVIGRQMIESLSDAEYAYMIDRGGEDYPERAYGVRYER